MTWPEYLDQLASMALLGTELSGPLGNSPFPDHDQLISGATAQEKEGQFLAAAAATFLYERAGVKGEILPAATAVAPAESRPLISQAASDRLQAILHDLHPEILGEFLELVGKHQKRLPPRFLPRIFSKAMREKALWPKVIPGMGERGHWLIGQNREWNLQAKKLDESDFHTGTREERIAYLKELREIEPAKARNLLQAGWADEKPDDRAELLETLLVGLSQEDEPFLQQTLVDRRREVREVSAEGLARLPPSAFSQRMESRLKDLIRVNPSKSGKETLSIEPPEKLPPDWQKDGIETKSKIQGLGDKAYHLFCLVGATPLSFWNQLADWTPDQWYETIYGTDWHDALLLGLAKASIRQKNPEWAIAVLRGWAGNPKSLEFATRRLMAENLLDFLDQPKREVFLLEWITRQTAGADTDTLSFFAFFLNAMDHPWSLDFSDKVLRFVIASAMDPKTQAKVIGIRWKEVGRFAHPDSHDRLLPLFQGLDDTWKTAMESFLSVLGFRQQMLREIAQ